MESRYIKIDYGEAVSAKKEILSSEINLLNIAKHIENYKQLRKKELLNKLNSINSSFPEEGKVKIKVKRTIERKETPKLRHMEDELEDIKNKLARLS